MFKFSSLIHAVYCTYFYNDCYVYLKDILLLFTGALISKDLLAYFY